MSTIHLTPIGLVRSPWKEMHLIPQQPSHTWHVQGQIILEEAFVDGASDLKGFSHIILLYHFHNTSSYVMRCTPFPDGPEKSIFSTRCPDRPNQLGFSAVRLLKIDKQTLHIAGVDMLDKTPVLDIKPHIPAYDCPKNVTIGWMEEYDRKGV